MKLLTFFCDLHIGNTDTEVSYEIQAGDLSEAVRLITMFSLGANFANGTYIELRGVSQKPRRGTKYGRIG